MGGDRHSTSVVPREVLLVYKKSKLDLYVHERKNPRYARLHDEGAPLIAQIEQAHQAHQRALESVRRTLKELRVPTRSAYRARMKPEGTHGRVVVTVGGDGTLLDASHKVLPDEDGRCAPLLGVNSDPERSVGFLCAATASTLGDLLEEVFSGVLVPTPVARVTGDVDGVPLPVPVLNEVLVADKNPAATTRCVLSMHDQSEEQKSSGIWIAAPAGTTAAIFSAGGSIQDLDDGRLQVRVREPYDADGRGVRLPGGFVSSGAGLRAMSKMREGKLYLDGPHIRVPFPFGAVLSLDVGAPMLPLVVTEEMRERRRRARAREHQPDPSPHV